MTEKSDYAILFDELYDKYVKSSDPNIWSYILKELSSFKKKLVSKSKLYDIFRDEAYQDIDIAIYNAFTSFDPDKNCSLYSWTYRLCSQAIYKLIKEKSTKRPVDYLDEINNEETPSYGEETLDDLYDDPELLEEILKNTIKGPLEFEAYCFNKGLFGKDKMTSCEISDEMRFDKNTVDRMLKTSRTYVSRLKSRIKEKEVTIETFSPDTFPFRVKVNKII